MTLRGYVAWNGSFGNFGEIRTDVLTLQCGLWQLGFDPGRFDGLWGPVTNAALDRWYRWWLAREGIRHEDWDGGVTVPPRNRPGEVLLPDAWRELVDAAGRGPCRRERRGEHRAPPVPEPVPAETPLVVVGPNGAAQEARVPLEPVRASLGGGSALMMGLLVAGAVGLYMSNRKEPEPDLDIGPDPYSF